MGKEDVTSAKRPRVVVTRCLQVRLGNFNVEPLDNNVFVLSNQNRTQTMCLTFISKGKANYFAYLSEHHIYCTRANANITVQGVHYLSLITGGIGSSPSVTLNRTRITGYTFYGQTRLVFKSLDGLALAPR